MEKEIIYIEIIKDKFKNTHKFLYSIISDYFCCQEQIFVGFLNRPGRRIFMKSTRK